MGKSPEQQIVLRGFLGIGLEEEGKTVRVKTVLAGSPAARAGLQAGLVLTFLMGLTFLITQLVEYARVGFAPHDNAFTTIFFCLTGLHGAHVFVGLTILLFATIRAFRGHFTAEHHYGVEIPGIYWHFVDVMWIVVYTTVYLL